LGHWNHRVIATKQDDPDNPYYYAIHEVHYDEAGNVEGWTVDPTPVSGEDLDDLKWVLESMQKCLGTPVLYEHELEAEMEARRQAREDLFQSRYGQLSNEERLQALDREIPELCPSVQDGKHCGYKVGHTCDHEFYDAEEMLRNQLWIEYYPLSRWTEIRGTEENS
jgi:hypothetical protein